jgi:hypothetical protein
MSARLVKMLDWRRCPKGYYWVRHKDKNPKKPWIVECRDGNSWWNMGWDVKIDMNTFDEKYVILGEVAPWRKTKGK